MIRIPDTLLRVISDPVVIVTGEGIILSANQAFIDLCGGKLEVKGQPLAGALGTSETECGEIIARCCRTSGPLVFAMHLSKAKGGMVRYRVTGMLVERGESMRLRMVCLRVLPHVEGVQKFLTLNEEISALKTEVMARQTAEIRLRVSEARFRAAVEAVTSLIWTNDVHGMMKGEQPGWGKFTGQTYDEYQGYGWSHAVHPKDAQSTIDAWHIAVAQKKNFDFEHRLRRHDGEWRICSIRAVPVITAGGVIREWVGVHTDITDRRQVEEASARLAAIVMSSDLAIISKTVQGVVTSWNRAAERLFGYAEEEMIGRPMSRLIPPDRLDEEPGILKRINRGESIEHYDTIRRRKDGTDVEISLTVSALFDHEGNVMGASQVLHDITARKRAEQRLRASEAFSSVVFESSPDCIKVLDAAGRILRMNATGQCLMEVDDVASIEGRFWWDFWPDDLRESVRASLTAARNGITGHFQAHCLTAKGTPKWWDVIVVPVYEPIGEVKYFISASRDMTALKQYEEGLRREVTERKQAEVALRKSEERLRAFAGQLEQLVGERTEDLIQSQDQLRALAIALNLAEQRERQRLAGELHDSLAQWLVLCRLNLGQVRREELPPHVEEKVRETEEVLDQALTYSRTLMAELSPSVLQEYGLSAGLAWLGEQMQRHGLHVTLKAGNAEDLSLPHDTAVLLFQSVRELLMNALKHAESTQVVVRLEQREDWLSLEVRDDGVGFDRATATSPVVTALSSKFGLFSIQERMKALGGWFDVQSAPGEGTRATLVLPLGAISSELAESANSHQPSPINSEADTSKRRPQSLELHQKDAKIRVLLVDDHAMVRQGLRSVLDSYADIAVVGEAWNGQEAVAATDQLRPDVVVMDINMPTMNGIEATAQIKARHPEVIVIGLSVNVSGENTKAMKQAGAAMLLTKEAAVDELYHAMCKTTTKTDC
ncbi:MAG: PAS domain S-box protein [Nitrospirota bacterium]